MNAINVIIVDDHPFVLKGIADFLKTAGDINVVALCRDGQMALEKIRELQPDVAIVDLSMPKMTGFEVLVAATKEKLLTRFLFLAALASPSDIMTAMAEGAYGFLQKDSRPHELLHNIREIAAGRKCLPYELISRSVHDESLKPSLEKLTLREWKVVALAAAGESNKEIGRKLNISAGTAKVHLHHIFRKIGVKNRTALAAIASRSSNDDRKSE
jgi:two-component system nitrate/nitrite response regulator NarL